MNTVTFETAKALRDAGFPQPFPAFGQQWYFPETKELFLVTFVYSDGQVDFSFEGSPVSMLTAMPEGVIFAPQAHDIIEQLARLSHPNLIRVDVSAYNNATPNEIREPQFLVYDFPYSNSFPSKFDKNPHEAAAKAFLKLSQSET